MFKLLYGWMAKRLRASDQDHECQIPDRAGLLDMLSATEMFHEKDLEFVAKVLHDALLFSFEADFATRALVARGVPVTAETAHALGFRASSRVGVEFVASLKVDRAVEATDELAKALRDVLSEREGHCNCSATAPLAYFRNANQRQT
ncbi:MAG: hypothetical protein ABNH38_18325 [Tateyamaria sp.]|jgi:hypothetical protein|uniref:hypothetical protein n=1 Tax=Tateyamaria sp. TaxID=1929288 RepID=UPI0032DC9E57